MKVLRATAAILLLGIPLLLFSACTQTSDSLEEQIDTYLVTVESAAKERNPLAIKSLVSENYLDEDGRNRQNVVSLATGYLLRNRNIHMLTHVKQLDFPQPDQAELVLLAGFAGKPIGDLETLLALQATIYLFELTLEKEGGDWLLTSARWRRATSADVF